MKKNEFTREKIKKAAVELFAEFGYAATTIKQIGKKAGVKSSALIYYYFEDKEGLFRACIEECDMPQCDTLSFKLEPIEYLVQLQEQLSEVLRDEYTEKAIKCILNMSLFTKDDLGDLNSKLQSFFDVRLRSYLEYKIKACEFIRDMDIDAVISNFYIVFAYRRFISKSIKPGKTAEEREHNHRLFLINAQTIVNGIKRR